MSPARNATATKANLLHCNINFQRIFTVFKASLRLCLTLFYLSLAGNAIAADVLASIKPLQLIARAITPDVEVLIPDGTDMHDFSLKPSSRYKLAQSKLLLWLGPVHEPYLTKIASQQDQQRQLDLSSLLTGLKPDDPHLWLSPQQAGAIAQHLTERLSQLHPEQANLYQRRLAQFQNQLTTLDTWVKAELAGLQPDYLVFHDAYYYFEQAYGFKPKAVVSNQHGQNPGAKSWIAILQQVEQGEIRCALITPDTPAAFIGRINTNDKVKIIKLDPLAADVKLESGGYLELIRTTTRAFKACAEFSNNSS